MRKYIHKHLDDKYYIKASEVGNDGIYLLVEKEEEYHYPVNNNLILDEVVTIFGVELEESKLEIHLWANKKKPDVDLEFYWNISNEIFRTSSFDNIHIRFPIVQRVFAKTIAQDLVAVQPMSMPKIDLVYLDYVYGPKPWYKKLWYKIKGLFKKKPAPSLHVILNHDTRKNQWLEQYSAFHLAQQNTLTDEL